MDGSEAPQKVLDRLRFNFPLQRLTGHLGNSLLSGQLSLILLVLHSESRDGLLGNDSHLHPCFSLLPGGAWAETAFPHMTGSGVGSGDP